MKMHNFLTTAVIGIAIIAMLQTMTPVSRSADMSAATAQVGTESVPESITLRDRSGESVLTITLAGTDLGAFGFYIPGETGTRPINWGKVWYDAAMPRMARLAIGDTAWWDLTTLKARVGEQGGRSGSSYYATKI